jgi:thioredoxin reductase
MDQPSTRNARTLVRLGAVLCTACLAACGVRDSPEAQVRAVIAAGETAAEARDLSRLMDLVSAQYRDDEGRDRSELQRYVHGYLIANQSIHLLTRVESVQFPYRDLARVSLTVGTLGRDASDATSLDLAADVERLTIELQLDDGDWKVTRAERADAG